MKTVQALGLLALTQLARAQDEPGLQYCICSNSCSVWGDPHITMFDNNDYVEKRDTFTIYKYKNFEITGTTFDDNNWYLGTFDFNGNMYSKDNCEDTVGKYWTDEHTFNDKTGSISAEITCAKRNGVFHLDVDLLKTNIGTEADWTTMENDLGSSGVCLFGSSDDQRRLLRGENRELRNVRTLAQSNIDCECCDTCELFGDPHAIDFDGEEAIYLEDGELLVYSESNFNVYADNEWTRVKILRWGDETYKAEEICTARDEVHTFEHTWNNGDRLVATSTCTTVGGSHGYFFNTFFQKFNPATSGKGETFQSLEESRNTDGACSLGGSQSRRRR